MNKNPWEVMFGVSRNRFLNWDNSRTSQVSETAMRKESKMSVAVQRIGGQLQKRRSAAVFKLDKLRKCALC